MLKQPVKRCYFVWLWLWASFERKGQKSTLTKNATTITMSLIFYCVQLYRKTEENEQLKHDQRWLYQGIVWKRSLTFFTCRNQDCAHAGLDAKHKKPWWADIVNRTRRLMFLYERQIVSFLHHELEHSETDWPHFSVGFPLHHYGPTWQQWKTCYTI